MSDDNTEEVHFGSLNFEERIIHTDARLGNQPERISDPRQLLNLVGETIYLVISPFGNGGNQNIGTCFLNNWTVGRLEDHRENEITDVNQVLPIDNKEKYLCYGYGSKELENQAISCRDFNILPNPYNNHAAFITQEAAEAYIVYRKLQHPEDPQIDELKGEYEVFFNNEDVQRLLKSEQEAEKAEAEEAEEAKKDE